MLLKSKKGKVFSIFLLVYLLIINVTLAYVVTTHYINKVDNEEGIFAVGEIQSSILMAYEQANNYYFSIKFAAKQAAKITSKQLGIQGLDPYADYSEDAKAEQGIITGNKCGEIMGVPVWYLRNATMPGLQIWDSQYWVNCIPNETSIKKSYLELFNREFLKLVDEANLPLLSYSYEINNHDLTARSDLDISVPLLSSTISQTKLSSLTNNYLQATENVDTPLANKGFIESPNKLEKDPPPRKISYVVLHYTASSTASSAITTFRNPKNKVSAHYIVDKNGDVYQMVREKDIAWHAGCSDAKNYGSAYCNPKYSNMNSKSIGIEIVNLGFNCEQNCVSAVPICYDDLIQKNCLPTMRSWDPYPPVQYDKVIELTADILYRNKLNEKAIIGHEEVNPIRKSDPGPLMNITKVREQVKKKLAELKKPATQIDTTQTNAQTVAHQSQSQAQSQSQSQNQQANPKTQNDAQQSSQQSQQIDCQPKNIANFDSKLYDYVKKTKANLEISIPDAMSFIKQVSGQEGVPLPIALSLITQESKGQDLVSRAGAFGVMQLTQTAIDDVDKNHKGSEFNCVPSEQNVKCQIEYGLRYLSSLSSKEKPYGGVTSYCTSGMHCFKTEQQCSLKEGSSACQAVSIDTRTYSGIDAQLRYYNGWSYYNYPDFDYVENVKKYVPYWESLLCLKNSLDPAMFDSVVVVGQHQIDADFQIKLDDTLEFYKEVSEFAKQTVKDCYNSMNPSDCLNGMPTDLDKKGITLQRDADCMLNYEEDYKNLYSKKKKLEAEAIIRENVDTLLDIKNCADNLQDNCTCKVKIPKRSTLKLKKDSKKVELEYDIGLLSKNELFKINVPFLEMSDDLDKEKEITFYKEDFQKMVLYQPKTNNKGVVDNSIKECESLPTNHLICATKNIGGEDRTIVFFLQFGYPGFLGKKISP